jgi:hypothetical protein
MSLKRVCGPRQLLDFPGVVLAVTDEAPSHAWNSSLGQAIGQRPRALGLPINARIKRRKG